MKKCLKRVMALFMTSSLLLSGCGAAESADDRKQETEGTETVELTVWGEKDNTATLTKMIDSFKEQYKGQADFNITLETQADSGGVLVPVPNAEEVSAENIKESVDAATLNGKLYGYPMTADNGYFMYYNKDYFTEEDVKSLDKMLSVAQAAGKKVAMEFNSGWYLYSFFGNTGLKLSLNEDGVTNACNWNDTSGDIRGVDIEEALKRITSNAGFLSCPNGEIADKMKSGEVIAGISGVWDVMNAKEAWGADYGACKLPAYTCAGREVQMASFTGYKMMGVNAYSKNKDWACLQTG